MNTRSLTATAALLLASCTPGSGLEVEHAWIRAAPPQATVLAGYMSIENLGSDPAVLVSVASDGFGRVEMHATALDDGIARMMRREQIEIPAGERAVLAPGGLHLMLMEPVASLSAGDEVTLTLGFADGRAVRVSAEVRRDAADDEHHRH